MYTQRQSSVAPYLFRIWQINDNVKVSCWTYISFNELLTDWLVDFWRCSSRSEMSAKVKVRSKRYTLNIKWTFNILTCRCLEMFQSLWRFLREDDVKVRLKVIIRFTGYVCCQCISDKLFRIQIGSLSKFEKQSSYLKTLRKLSPNESCLK